jgi:tetratricopeptide (TPR) repeat protein
MARLARRVLPAVAIALAACAPLQLALLQNAVPLLSIALDSRSDDDANARRIAELKKAEDWRGLQELGQRQVDIDPSDAKAWFILGYAQFRLGDYVRSTDAFSQVVKRAPEDIDAWNMLGESQRLAGRPERAVATLENATTVNPSLGETRYLLGRAREDAGRTESAIVAYRDATKLAPEYAPGWYRLGLLLAQTGRTDEYSRVLERLNEIDKGLAQELRRRGARE